MRFSVIETSSPRSNFKLKWVLWFRLKISGNKNCVYPFSQFTHEKLNKFATGFNGLLLTLGCSSNAWYWKTKTYRRLQSTDSHDKNTRLKLRVKEIESMVLQTMKNFSTQGIAFTVTIHFSLLNLDLLGGSNYLKKINFLLQEKSTDRVENTARSTSGVTKQNLKIIFQIQSLRNSP